MFTNTKIALAAALILGTASAALGNDIDINPSTAQSAREWAEYLGQSQKRVADPRTSYGYVASATQRDDLSQSRKKSHNR
jgi:hypothetical protein